MWYNDYNKRRLPKGIDVYDLAKGWLPVEDAYINPESQYWLILPGRELYKY
jgi:hypothetical protein